MLRHLHRSQATRLSHSGSFSVRAAPSLYRCAPSILVLFGVPALPVALAGQGTAAQGTEVPWGAAGRIWGRVETVSGVTHEGFIRWDRNEGSWVDVLDGSKGLRLDDYLVWNDRTGEAEPVPERVVEYGGYRISFPDHLSSLPATTQSGIRFGHIRRLEARDARGAVLELKSGETLELSGGGTDLGRALREMVVEEPGGREVKLGWSDVAAVEFGPAPPGAVPSGARLHGTVRDGNGREYTGFIAWNADKILDTDRLEGREGGAGREIPFSGIASVARTDAGARVALAGGSVVELTGPGDVSRGGQWLVVSDPGLGSVELRWRNVESVRFHPPSPPQAPLAHQDFPGGWPLEGTVVTREGHELTGLIRWDADEEYSWELLGGRQDGVLFQVEFGEIAEIERLSGERVTLGVGVQVTVERSRRDGALVTLRDGRTLELSGSNDVSGDNKGIWVRADPDSDWVSVRWADFKMLRLHPPGTGGRP
jgi:hypothetical protein